MGNDTHSLLLMNNSLLGVVARGPLQGKRNIHAMDHSDSNLLFVDLFL
jgi:hypothetical protein